MAGTVQGLFEPVTHVPAARGTCSPWDRSEKDAALPYISHLSMALWCCAGAKETTVTVMKKLVPAAELAAKASKPYPGDA